MVTGESGVWLSKNNDKTNTRFRGHKTLCDFDEMTAFRDAPGLNKCQHKQIILGSIF